MFKLLPLVLSAATVFNLTSPILLANESDVNKTMTLTGYSTVNKDLNDLKINASTMQYEFGKLLALSQQVDKNKHLNTFLYISYSDVDSPNTNTATISTVLDNVENFHETYKEYNLKKVSYDKELQVAKFEILGLENSKETVRRFRVKDFDSIDPVTKNSLGVTYVPKAFYFSGFTNETLETYYKKPEVITITEKEVVDFRYGDTLNLFGIETGEMKLDDIYNDGWFVFFNTDKVIDTLMEVELTYQQIDYHFTNVNGKEGKTKLDSRIDYNFLQSYATQRGFKGDVKNSEWSQDKSFQYYEWIKPQPQTIKTIYPGTKQVQSLETGWFGSYQWHYATLDNIMDLTKYKAENESAFVFTQYANIYKWGVHFNDTPLSFKSTGKMDSLNRQIIDWTGSTIADTAILRLKFMTSGKLYNLKAVDSKTDDISNEPAETPPSEDLTLWEKISYPVKILTGIILGILAILIIAMVVQWIVKFINWVNKKSDKDKKKEDKK